jgi:hypothetical protein
MDARQIWTYEDARAADAEVENQYQAMKLERAGKAAKEAAATPVAATPTAKTDSKKLEELEKKTGVLAEASTQLGEPGGLSPQLIQKMLPAKTVSSTHPPPPPHVSTPRTTVVLSKIPIVWGYQDAGSWGEHFGKNAGSLTKWAAHRNPFRRHHISSINDAEDNRPIRIEFTQDRGKFKIDQSIKLHDKNSVIQFINENLNDIISGGGKRRKRKSHKRKSHKRKSHKRKSHKRKSHKRKSHKRKSHKRKRTKRRR